MKRLFAVLLLIFTLGALSVYAEEEIKFDAVIYVGTGEGITNGKGETPETACATLDKAVGRFVPGKENYHIILVGDTVFEHEMQIKKKYVYISGNGVITPKIIGTFSGRTRDGEAYMFDVSEKSTLVLGGEDSNIVIDGCAYESEYEFGSVNYRGPDNCYINNNGTLILRDGVSIQNINVVHPGEYSRQGYIQANNKRAIAVGNSGTAEMDGAKRLVTLKKDDIIAELTIGADRIIVNGSPVVMDTAARIENDRTYIPGRYIGETLGYSVEWIDGCVFINSLK